MAPKTPKPRKPRKPKKVTYRTIVNYAARLLENNRLAKGQYAKKANGTVCSLADEKAACFCIFGALHRAAIDLEVAYERPRSDIYATSSLGEPFFDAFLDIASAETELSRFKIHSRFNDLPKTSKADVVNLLRTVARKIEPVEVT